MVRVFRSVVYLRIRSATYGLDYVSYGTVLSGRYRRGDASCTYAALYLMQGSINIGSTGINISSFPVNQWYDFSARIIYSTTPSYKIASVDKVYRVVGIARNIPIPAGKAMIVACFGSPPSSAIVLNSSGKTVAILVPHRYAVYGMDAVVLVPEYDNEPVTIDASLCDFCLYAFLDLDLVTVARETFTVRVTERCGSIERVYPLMFPGLSLFVSEVLKKLITLRSAMSAAPKVTYVPPAADPYSSAWMPSEGWTHVWQFESETELNDFEVYGSVSISNGNMLVGSSSQSGSAINSPFSAQFKYAAMSLKVSVSKSSSESKIAALYRNSPSGMIGAALFTVPNNTGSLNLCDYATHTCSEFTPPAGYMVILVDLVNGVAKVFDALGNEIASVSLSPTSTGLGYGYSIEVLSEVSEYNEFTTDVDWIAIDDGSGIRDIYSVGGISKVTGFAYPMILSTLSPPIDGGTGSFDSDRGIYIVTSAENSSGYLSMSMSIQPNRIGVAIKVIVTSLSGSVKVAKLSVSDGISYAYIAELYIEPGSPYNLVIKDVATGLTKSVVYDGDWVVFVIDRVAARAYLYDRYGNQLAYLDLGSATPTTKGCSIWVGSANYPGSNVVDTLVDYVLVDPDDLTPVNTSLGGQSYSPVVVLHLACSDEPKTVPWLPSVDINGFSIDGKTTIAKSQSTVSQSYIKISDYNFLNFAIVAISLSISSAVAGQDIVRFTIDDGTSRYDAAIRTTSSTSQIELYDYVSGASQTINLPSGTFIVLFDASLGKLEVYDTSGNLLGSISISSGSSVSPENTISIYGYSNYNGVTVTTSVDWVAYA